MDMIKLTFGTLPKTPIDCTSHIERANKNAGHGDERWRDLWDGSLRSTHEKCIQELVTSLRSDCRNLIVIGIGGSSLGTKAIHRALTDANWNLRSHEDRPGPRLFVLDNIDASTVASTCSTVRLDDPDLRHTVVCVISKSGETIEIASNLMCVLQSLEGATFLAITGESGSLRDLAREHDWPTLLVPDGVGGRFSALSPVGLFPAALCGVDIAAVLDGAKAMNRTCSELENNPAASLASFLIGHAAEGRNVQIMMPYSDGLTNLAHWWVQLWAESLGKINEDGIRTGPTPMVSIGVTDQHSVLQLWREGPTDKVIGFVNVEQGQNIDLGNRPISTNLEWLCGRSMHEVLKAEQEATTESLRDADQPTWTLTFPRVDACTIGQFFALWEITTAIAGRILRVNPFDQPGVDLVKKLTRDQFETGEEN